MTVTIAGTEHIALHVAPEGRRTHLPSTVFYFDAHVSVLLSCKRSDVRSQANAGRKPVSFGQFLRRSNGKEGICGHCVAACVLCLGQSTDTPCDFVPALALRPNSSSYSRRVILRLSTEICNCGRIRGRRPTRNAISCPRMPCVRVLLGGDRPEFRRSSTIVGRGTRLGRPVPVPKSSKLAGMLAIRGQLHPPAACTCCLFPFIHPLPPIIDLGEKTQVAGVDIKGLRNHTIFSPFSVGFSGTIFWKILFGDESMVQRDAQKNIFDRKNIFIFYLKNYLKYGKIGKN